MAIRYDLYASRFYHDVVIGEQIAAVSLELEASTAIQYTQKKIVYKHIKSIHAIEQM